MDFDYKKYSLENLEKWMSDALVSSEATPQEIYDVIHKVVEEEYHYFKHHTGRCYELLALLGGTNNLQEQVKAQGDVWDKEDVEAILAEREYYEGVNQDKILSCDKDDKSPECQKSWTSFWEENYYPEEYKQYTEEEMNAMCDKAALEQDKEKCQEYNLREAEYYNKRAQLDAEVAAIKSSGGYEWTPEPDNKKSFSTQNGVTYSDYVKAKIEAGSSWNDGWTKKHYQDIVDKYEGKVDKVKKWILPVEETKIAETDETEYFVSFPDDLLEAADLKEGDQVYWVDNGDGTWIISKVTKPLGMDEC
jgi:hypothetical protein